MVMKRSIALWGMLLMCSCVYASTNDVSTFTPSEMGDAHWTKIGETQGDVFWYAYSIERIGCIGSGDVDNRCATVNVDLKDATKGLGDGYNALSILRGTVICNSYALPQDLFDANISTFNLHSIPISEMTNDYAGRQIPLQRGTALADAVVRICKSVNVELTKTGLPARSPLSSLHDSGPAPASGKCSIPRPSYPINAMRQGKQGVATVAFDIAKDGRTSNLSILSSSGSPDLDHAALAAVSRGRCSMAAGKRMSTTVTFGLQH